jgi:hypothetical protein
MSAAKKLTSAEAILSVFDGNSRKAMTGKDLVAAGLPLTKLGGKDPEHSFYMNLHKEASRADGLVVKVKKDGKTTFKLNPKRRDLNAPRITPKAAKAPKKAAAKQLPSNEEVAAEVGAQVAELFLGK